MSCMIYKEMQDGWLTETNINSYCRSWQISTAVASISSLVAEQVTWPGVLSSDTSQQEMTAQDITLSSTKGESTALL